MGGVTSDIIWPCLHIFSFDYHWLHQYTGFESCTGLELSTKFQVDWNNLIGLPEQCWVTLLVHYRYTCLQVSVYLFVWWGEEESIHAQAGCREFQLWNGIGISTPCININRIQCVLTFIEPIKTSYLFDEDKLPHNWGNFIVDWLVYCHGEGDYICMCSKHYQHLTLLHW